MTRAGAAAAIVLALLLAAPLFLPSSYFTFMLILVFIYSIVSIGLNLLVGYAGQFSLGHAALMAMGAYLSAAVSKTLGAFPLVAFTGLHVWIGMLAGTLAAALAGAVLAFPAMRLRGPYLAMVTIGFGWMVWRVLLEWVPVTGGDLGIASIPRPRFGSYILNITGYYYLALAALVVAFAVQRNLVYSDLGRKIRALKHSEIAAASVGIDVYREKVKVFVTSAVFAGFGGALFAHLQNFINPDNFQFFTSVFFLLAILFGGAGTLIGPVIGAAFLTILPETLHEAEHFRLVLYGIIILVTLFVFPRGIAGLIPAAPRSFRPPVQGRPEQLPRGEEAVGVERQKGVTAPAPLMIVERIDKSFGGVKALAGVGLAVTAGRVHAVIGPNGAGKTTLINIMSGFYRPDAGQIILHGMPTALDSLHDAALKGVARTFQSIKLFGDMTVREHVMIGCEPHSEITMLDVLVRTRNYRHEEAKRRQLAAQLMDDLGLSEFADVPASTLAYGHRRLLEIARALAGQPQLLLLDEPAAGLVASEIAVLAKFIRDLRRRGLAIVLIEHHMDLVMRVSDMVTVLDYGEVISHGDPNAVRRDPRVIEAYLGAADEEETAVAAR